MGLLANQLNRYASVKSALRPSYFKFLARSKMRNARKTGPMNVPSKKTSPSSIEIENLLEQARVHDSIVVPTISSYQKEVAKYPSLSPEKQTSLVSTYQATLVLQVSLDNRTLPPKKRPEALKLVNEGNNCLAYLIISNSRLVQLLAREQYIKRYPSRDRILEMLPDLIDEGNLALTEAAQKYDVSRGPYFPSYAARAVRDRIRYVLSNYSVIKMSASWSRLQRIAKRAIPEQEKIIGRKLTTPEIKAMLLKRCLTWAKDKLSPLEKTYTPAKQEAIMLAKLRKQGMLGAIDAIEEILALSRQVSSLDAPLSAEAGTTIADVIPNTPSSELFDDIELEELSKTLSSVLASLPERDRMIIMYRYGFVDGDSWTYDKISELYDVSSERIRQIERAALCKLSETTTQFSALSSFLPSQFKS